MGAYWMFEIFPLAITGLLPVILFPILGVLPSNAVCVNYLKVKSSVEFIVCFTIEIKFFSRTQISYLLAG